MTIGEKVWRITAQWDYFLKYTIGKQWVWSTDSIAANISEGYGRYHYKESKHFYYYARGSLFETKTWIQKAHHRKLIDLRRTNKRSKPNRPHAERLYQNHRETQEPINQSPITNS